ncbi:hypothetical protein IJ732_00145 [bacterium]|nr:hypothetical protein [bacterium]
MAISALKNIPTPLTAKEMKSQFLKHHFSRDLHGTVQKNLSSLDVFMLSGKTGHYASDIAKIAQTPFSAERQEDFQGFLALGKTKEFVCKYFERMFLLFNVLSQNSRQYRDANKIYQDNKDYSELFRNLVTKPPKNAATLDAFRHYKGIHCGGINGVLRGESNIKDKTINSEIKKISKYLNKQVIKENVKLYRGEGFEVLNKVQLNNGKTIDLEKELEEARFDKKRLQKLNEMFLDNEVIAHQPSFMSTTISKDLCNEFGHSGFYWELTTAPNTKAAYIEPLVINSCMDDEREVLLQKGSNIKIKGVEFDEKYLKWCVKGEVSN